ncbi:MAG: hypothetical protein EOO08_01085 [Chitinophagaceae bacterium]|nr:MAG: hypothetical protein EOO08_01085 [Chitinophagaceae bacterium]
MMVIIIGIIIALSFAYYFRQKQRIALEDRQEELRRKQEKLLELLRIRKEREAREERERGSGDGQPV